MARGIQALGVNSFWGADMVRLILLGFFVGIGIVVAGAAWVLLGNDGSSPDQALKQEDILHETELLINGVGPRRASLTLRFPEPLKEQFKAGDLSLPQFNFFLNAKEMEPPITSQMLVSSNLESQSKVSLLFNERDRFFSGLKSAGGFIQMTICHKLDPNSDECNGHSASSGRLFRGRGRIGAVPKEALSTQATIDLGEITLQIYHNPNENCKSNSTLRRRLVLTEAYQRKFPAAKYRYFFFFYYGPGRIAESDFIKNAGQSLSVVPADLGKSLSVDFSQSPALRNLPSVSMYLVACPLEEAESACVRRIEKLSVFQEQELFFGQSERARAIKLVQDNFHSITCTKEERVLYANWFPEIDASRGLFKMSEGLPKGLLDGYVSY